MNKWNIFEEYKEINIDIDILTKLNFIILTQLRTGHIKLNLCLHQLNHMPFYKDNLDKFMQCNDICCSDNNSGYCINCKNQLESVYHFIMECKKYEKQRDILYYETMRIFVIYQIDFKLRNLLFPPPNIKNQHRKHILNSLCTYALNTRRLFFYCS